MLKKAFSLVAMVAVVITMTGCFTLENSHNRNHLRAWQADFNRIHETLDRHFFNYDWDDPSDY